MDPLLEVEEIEGCIHPVSGFQHVQILCSNHPVTRNTHKTINSLCVDNLIFT